MIDVENLTKRYPAKTAVDGMSFKVEKGEIRFELRNHLNRGRAVGDLAQHQHPIGGTQRGDAFPDDVVVVGEY